MGGVCELLDPQDISAPLHALRPKEKPKESFLPDLPSKVSVDTLAQVTLHEQQQRSVAPEKRRRQQQ